MASINAGRLSLKLKEFAKVANKELAEAVKEEALLTAQSLVKLTPPGKAAEGKKRVAIDLGRVYLPSKWFLEVFQFRNQKLGEKVKEAVRKKDSAGLEEIFDNSGKLRRIKVETFDPSKHGRLRRNGRVPKSHNPKSFPVAQESAAKRYQTQKQKMVGTAKAGWAACLQALGKGVAGWLNKPGTGAIKNNLNHPTKPSVTLINKVPYFASINARKKVIETALQGRLKALTKKIAVSLRLAARRV